jgi:hypothetical protein
VRQVHALVAKLTTDLVHTVIREGQTIDDDGDNDDEDDVDDDGGRRRRRRRRK